ncbi:hypothetical protein [Maricaulis maris]|jgi:hypothetical protein|uniref:hypothetical protein n=1 Tax=Maricaulis maris TaxID=74318 RepID=UPI0026F1FD85|nr:hypothetical protein [Maricaulis maris]
MKHPPDVSGEDPPTLPPEPAAEGERSTPSVLDFLQNESAVRNLQSAVIEIMNSARKSHKTEWAFRIGGILVVVGAVILLSLLEKLDPTAAVILGSIAGFLFGKSPKE